MRSANRSRRCAGSRRSGRSCRRLGRSDDHCRRARLRDGCGRHELRRGSLGRGFSRHGWLCRCWSRGSFWFCCQWWSGRRRLGDGTSWGWRGCFCLLLYGSQHISRTGDIRQVDLGLDLVFGAGARGFRGSRRLFGMSAEILADQYCLVLLDRAGVRLLFGNSDFGKRVKNRLALDFQLPRQIVDSNLAHPPSRLLVSAKLSYRPQGRCVSC